MEPYMTLLTLIKSAQISPKPNLSFQKKPKTEFKHTITDINQTKHATQETLMTPKNTGGAKRNLATKQQPSDPKVRRGGRSRNHRRRRQQEAWPLAGVGVREGSGGGRSGGRRGAHGSGADRARVKLLLQTKDGNAALLGRARRFRGFADCVARTVRDEGSLSLWRGNGTAVLRYYPFVALNSPSRYQDIQILEASIVMARRLMKQRML